jgi:hypothetical protein
LLGISFAISLDVAACRSPRASTDSQPVPVAAVASDAVLPARSAPEPGTLPEDPEAGAKSVAEWRQHLEHEEVERRLGYDRRRLPEHRALLTRLHAVRQRYDRARTSSAVLSAQTEFRATRPLLDERFDAIDHWGVSSKVLPDYRKLVETFSDAYPNARAAALSGQTAPFEQMGREVDERFAAIDAWLHAAAESDDD